LTCSSSAITAAPSATSTVPRLSHDQRGEVAGRQPAPLPGIQQQELAETLTFTILAAELGQTDGSPPDT